MKQSTYLVVSKSGVERARRFKPDLKGGEIAIKLNLEISDKFFDRCVPVANLKVPDDFVIEPEVKAELIKPDPSFDENVRNCARYILQDRTVIELTDKEGYIKWLANSGFDDTVAREAIVFLKHTGKIFTNEEGKIRLKKVAARVNDKESRLSIIR